MKENSTSSEEQAIILTILAEPGVIPFITDSILGKCSICKKSIWLSPSSIKIILERNAKACCVICGTLLMDSNSKMGEPTVEQTQEILKYFVEQAKDS